MKKVFIIISLVLIFVSIVWAGCKSDCRDEYDSEVESCKLMYDDPDDSDDLRMCIENAKDDYDSCKDDCNS